MLHFVNVLTSLTHERYCSGQALAEQLGVTRAAIHNCILRIEELGIGIDHVRGLGYRLQQPLELLSAQKITKELSAQINSKLSHIECLQEIDSTNRYAVNLEMPQAGCFAVVFSEMQTAGKGRRGRVWESPYAANLYMSIVWSLQRPLHSAGLLSPYCAICVAESLHNMGVGEVGVKWPNDIYCANKKLAGVLIECVGEIKGACKIVIGVGVNVSMSKYKNIQISQNWTDILSQTPDWAYTRNQLAAELINTIVAGLELFEKNQLGRFTERWSQWDVVRDTQVEVRAEHVVTSGIARGINEQGCLRLETSSGIENIAVGEISMRAIV